MKRNAALKQNRRNKTKNTEAVNYKKANFKKVSPKDLERITQNIKARAKVYKRKCYIRLTILCIVFTSIILSVIIYFF
jgi:lipopolysaccharide/colanic/teichoic acid biosynthesis glycosyltransferase